MRFQPFFLPFYDVRKKFIKKNKNGKIKIMLHLGQNVTTYFNTYTTIFHRQNIKICTSKVLDIKINYATLEIFILHICLVIKNQYKLSNYRMFKSCFFMHGNIKYHSIITLLFNFSSSDHHRHLISQPIFSRGGLERRGSIHHVKNLFIISFVFGSL